MIYSATAAIQLGSFGIPPNCWNNTGTAPTKVIGTSAIIP
ncbi:hypothetical protein NT06LI_2574 [Listeria innocua FSL J1-023]|nr:hypothetical protein NT06LI_2574 [Listeria innocua FSL J1-023]